MRLRPLVTLSDEAIEQSANRHETINRVAKPITNEAALCCCFFVNRLDQVAHNACCVINNDLMTFIAFISVPLAGVPGANWPVINCRARMTTTAPVALRAKQRATPSFASLNDS